MAMRRNKKGKYPFNEEKAVDPCDHAQNPPQIVLSFCKVFVIMTVSVTMEAKDLQRRQRGNNKTFTPQSTQSIFIDVYGARLTVTEWLCVLYLWYEVQECVS